MLAFRYPYDVFLKSFTGRPPSDFYFFSQVGELNKCESSCNMRALEIWFYNIKLFDLMTADHFHLHDRIQYLSIIFKQFKEVVRE